MNYANNDITRRAQESTLWPALAEQRGKALPYLLERYLLMENWRRESGGSDEANFTHLVLADAVTALLAHEEKLRLLTDAVERTGVTAVDAHRAARASQTTATAESRPKFIKCCDVIFWMDRFVAAWVEDGEVAIELKCDDGKESIYRVTFNEDDDKENEELAQDAIDKLYKDLSCL